MKPASGILCLAVLFAATCTAVAEDGVVLKRLVKAPESIEETFYRFEKNEAEINGLVIQKISLNYEAGKGGGHLKIHYKNKTKVEVVPDFLVRLYNPFGVCMGGVHVSGDNMNTPAPVAPGNKGVSQHRFGIFQMEAYIRHGLKDKLPADFANLAWVSIARSNTVLVEKPPKKKRVLRFELLNKE